VSSHFSPTCSVLGPRGHVLNAKESIQLAGQDVEGVFLIECTLSLVQTTPEEGGETVFPLGRPLSQGSEWSPCAREGLSLKAVRGDAVLFWVSSQPSYLAQGHASSRDRYNQGFRKGVSHCHHCVLSFKE
jgi:hypothetical protein